MLDRQVALHAINFMIGHVLLVQELMVVYPFQIVLPVMADGAPLVRHFTLTACQIAMATRAIHSAGIGQIVIERRPASQVENF